MSESDWTPSSRAGHVAGRLAQGGTFTVAEAVRKFGISQRTARKMFEELAEVLPIYCDAYGRWRRLPPERVDQSAEG